MARPKWSPHARPPGGGVEHDGLTFAQTDGPHGLGEERVLRAEAAAAGAGQRAHRQEPDAVRSAPSEPFYDVVDIGVEADERAVRVARARSGLFLDVVEMVRERDEVLGLVPRDAQRRGKIELCVGIDGQDPSALAGKEPRERSADRGLADAALAGHDEADAPVAIARDGRRRPLHLTHPPARARGP
ncbi:MAG: hypothetical protein WEC14_00570 [Chloroflexota bacterium]